MTDSRSEYGILPKPLLGRLKAETERQSRKQKLNAWWHAQTRSTGMSEGSGGGMVPLRCSPLTF